jgi:hypothetical protein
MSIYAPILPIGGQGGDPFQNYGLTGKVLKKIEVFRGDRTPGIRGIRVLMTGDAEATLYGTAEGSSEQYTFQPGERITSMSLSGNGRGTRTGWISFRTNTGGSLSYGMEEGQKKQYPIDVGSGICVGVMGRAGGDLDELAFVFLNPVRSAIMQDVRYPTLTADTKSILPVSLATFSDRNTSTTAQNWEFSDAPEKQVSETWALTVGLEAYMQTTVEAGVPEVASVSGTFGWKVSGTSTHSLTQTRTRKLSWKKSGTLEPGQSISLVAVTREGKLSIPYTGTMVITMESGTPFSYPVSGEYKGVEYTGVDVQDAVQAAALGLVPLRRPETAPNEAEQLAPA